MPVDPEDLGRVVEAIDSHTEGEPTRVVTAGLGEILGESMAAKSAFLENNFDEVRRALVNEPRGYDAIVLAYLTAPVTEEADAGVVFANDDGYLGMCGHGTIGVATVLVRLGLIEAREPTTEVVLDTPAGQVTATVHVEGGAPRSVAFRNIPSHVQREGLSITVPDFGDISIDIAYGGNWFGFVSSDQVGLPVEPSRLDDLMAAAKKIRRALEVEGITGDDQARIDHLVIWADESRPGQPACRALTLCPGNAYDRSPCGTGTSAKLALLHARGELAQGQPYLSRSILGTEFRGSVVGVTKAGDRDAVIGEIEGSAYVTGVQRFVLDPDDPWVHGLRPRQSPPTDEQNCS